MPAAGSPVGTTVGQSLQSIEAMPSPAFTGEYAPNGKELRAQVRAESGHRCIRCGHPYETGLKRADKGEWSACDGQCTHGPVIRIQAPGDLSWVTVHKNESLLANIPVMVLAGVSVEAQWRILTVHHFTGEKNNDHWWNNMALCQVCHLSVQSRVNPEIPFMFEHSEWAKPYVAGFYAFKYLGKELTREEVMADLETLLALERRV